MSSSRRVLDVIQPTLPRRGLLLVGAAAGLVACSDDAVMGGADAAADGGNNPLDTGNNPVDTGNTPVDTGSTPVDTGNGPVDTGNLPVDAGGVDVVSTDTGPLDAGRADTGTADTGPADTGPADTGPADTGPADTGPSGPPAGFLAVGPVSNFALNRWVAATLTGKGREVIVGRDSGGLFVYSAVCTHSGCTVPPPSGAGQNSTCPCHSSRFNDQGAVVNGPAAQPLNHFAAVIVNATVYANPSMVVASATRTAVA